MKLSPKSAHAHLPQVDPGRLYKGWPVGLRDGALLALIAAGFSAVEISALRASAVTMAGGRVVVTVHRDGVPLSAVLPVDLGARVLAWLNECRLWAADVQVFTSPRGPLHPKGICKVLGRYRSRSRASERMRRRNK